MPELTIQIGGRGFEVSCQEGEEVFLQAAAKLLDDEAQVLSDQIGRMPESRMLLMAGLMLADKAAATGDKINSLENKLAEAESELRNLRSMPQPEPERIEVAVVPPSVTDTLAELAARAEAMAVFIEEKSTK
ncbi:cell division protein ZapA [Ruegeria faecimaris]|uniref:cell division protein ZapA n=1 Tax=Ruegeria faecimaris TaxID=686389 RepID=UPI00232D3C27|nr:cell division protein ZapA [Ruegeria faecimaris]